MLAYDNYYKLPCVYMRGGTSKGLVIRSIDLPSNTEIRDNVICSVYGSSIYGQIDGIGGNTSLTSKVAIVSPTKKGGCDVSYLFGQVSIFENKIDYNVTCGNMASAVGLFAVEEGMVEITSPITNVRVYNENTHKAMLIEVPIKDGVIDHSTQISIGGVQGSSFPVNVNFMDVGGAMTGTLLPTGNAFDLMKTSFGEVRVSVLDVGNVVVIIHAKAVGISGIELSQHFVASSSLMQRLEEVRVHVGREIGLFTQDQIVSPFTDALPKMIVVADAQSYITDKDMEIKRENIDIVSRYISMGTLHNAFAVSGAIGVATASQIKGSVVERVLSTDKEISIGHPSGIIEVKVNMNDKHTLVENALVKRTARRLMEGYVSVPKTKLTNKNIEEENNYV